MTHPPAGPTTPPPPSGPKSDDLIFSTVDQLLADLDLPARRVSSRHVASCDTATGELGPNPSTREVGECLTPGYAVALAGATRESAGSVVDPGAGANVPAVSRG